jgi:HK97 family phage prohead protease
MKMELRLNQQTIQANEDGSLTVSGYVNKTEQWSELLGRSDRFKEKITRGAFQRAIDKSSEIHFLAEHDNKKILSSTRNGSLQLVEDEIGLHMTANISPTSWGKDYYQLVKDGIISNMSFGFRAIKDAWKKVDGYFERTVNELELFEVSLVRDPAYSQSTVSARGIDVVEDIKIPDVEINGVNIKFEIRSDEDLEKLANTLFEKLYEKLNGAKPPVEQEQVEEVVEEVVEEKVEEPEVVIEEVVEPVVEEEIVEEPVTEEVPVGGTLEAEKIRDFINKIKGN